MLPYSIIDSLFQLKSENLQQHRTLAFRPGQIFYGQVTKLFPNQMAQVQIGAEKVIAKLEIPLTLGDKYWFQVQPGEGKIHLKVLSSEQGTTSLPIKNHEGSPSLPVIKYQNVLGQDATNSLQSSMKQQGEIPVSSIRELLKQLNLPPVKEHVETVRFLLKEHLPMMRETIQSVSSLLQNSKSPETDQKIVKELIARDLPLTKEIFISVKTSLSNDPFHQILQNLKNKLSDWNRHYPTYASKQLEQGIHELFALGKKTNLENGKEVALLFKQLVSKIGFNYENHLKQTWKQETLQQVENTQMLKGLLMKFLDENSSSSIKQATEHVLNKITGVQLLSQESGGWQQYVMQIPIPLPRKMTDLTVQWNGRKKENGQIDPDYCRILFFLELERLNECIVDLHIQNRIINVTVINDTKKIKEAASTFIPLLKEKLKELNYHLSAVQFQTMKEREETPSKKTTSFLQPPSQTYGVDIRI